MLPFPCEGWWKGPLHSRGEATAGGVHLKTGKPLSSRHPELFTVRGKISCRGIVERLFSGVFW